MYLKCSREAKPVDIFNTSVVTLVLIEEIFSFATFPLIDFCNSDESKVQIKVALIETNDEY